MALLRMCITLAELATLSTASSGWSNSGSSDDWTSLRVYILR